MRIVGASLAVLVMVAAVAEPARAAPETEALQVLSRWAAAFSASDVDGIVTLYAPDALFLGTGSRTVVSDPAGIRRYFEEALLTRRPRGAAVTSPSVRQLSPDAVLITGLDEVSGVNDGTPFSSPGRITFVIAKRDAGWQIVHFHRSAMPR